MLSIAPNYQWLLTVHGLWRSGILISIGRASQEVDNVYESLSMFRQYYVPLVSSFKVRVGWPPLILMGRVQWKILLWCLNRKMEIPERHWCAEKQKSRLKIEEPANQVCAVGRLWVTDVVQQNRQFYVQKEYSSVQRFKNAASHVSEEWDKNGAKRTHVAKRWKIVRSVLVRKSIVSYLFKG